MGYIEQSLGASETLVERARFHWIYKLQAWLALIFLGIFIIGIWIFFKMMIRMWTTEIAVTTHRFIEKTGWFTLRTNEIALPNIEGVRVEQLDLLHRLQELAARNEMTGPVFKIANDPRITKSGAWLRKYSLDELPQLYSVLKGDMGLVGPRPPLVTEFEQFSDYQKQKMAVKPGITCLWQVSGRNQISDFDEWVRLDLEYISRWSLSLDLAILLHTVETVFSGSGK